MKKFRNEKGAITIIVLVSVLFFVSFLISSYVIIANKVQAQKEIVAQTRSIYENYNIEDVYNSYFGANIIPISTKEQLLDIGTGVDKIIDNNYYNFANNEKTIYVLTNDIEFVAYEEEILKDENGEYYWTPIGERTDLESKFEGNGHTITVNYKDAENDEYSVVYSEEKEYKELEYKVKITPRILSEDGEIATNATVYTAIETDNEFVPQEENGQVEITVKRLRTTNVYTACEGYKNSGTLSIYIDNPDKIQSYNLVLGKYAFTINATPSNAVITINGNKTNTVSVTQGETVTWKVEATNYITQEGSEVINEDKTLNIDLDIIKYILTIIPSPSDATVNISYPDGTTLVNAQGTQSIELIIGTNVNWSVSKLCYYGQSGSATMSSDIDVPVTLTSKPEQTKVLTPTSINASSVTNASSAKSDADSGSYGYGSGNASLEWIFVDSTMPAQAKITKIVARYKIASTIAGSSSTITLKSASRTCFTREISDIGISGATYGSEATNLPIGAELNSGLTLKANKNPTGIANFMRWYGADLTITYIEP